MIYSLGTLILQQQQQKREREEREREKVKRSSKNKNKNKTRARLCKPNLFNSSYKAAIIGLFD